MDNIIGCEEWCALPELGLNIIKAKIDSGTKTSALHAFNIHTRSENGMEYVYFDIHPIQDSRNIIVNCRSRLIGRRVIRSSNGLAEMRPIITTKIQLGKHTWDIEISLSNRDLMGYRMLLGREAIMANGFLVDPERKMLLSALSVEQQQQSSLEDAKSNGLKRPLSIAILASDPTLYSNRRLLSAGQHRGHDIRFLSVNNCYISIKNNIPSLHYRETEDISNFDAVIPRLRPSATSYGCTLLRHFGAIGTLCINGADAVAHANDKLRCLQTLSSKGISMPDTSFGHSRRNIQHLVSKVGGAPLVLKLLEGAQGTGVMLLNNNNSAESVIGAFKSVKADILVQQYLDADAEDIRCFIIDNKVVATMKRRGRAGDFRSSLHLGGQGYSAKITKEQKKMAVNAARALGLVVAGVDFIIPKNGEDNIGKVIEVNSSPGLKGIEGVSGLDIATLIIQSIEKKIYGNYDKN